MHRYLIWNWKNYMKSSEGDDIFHILEEGAYHFSQNTFILAPDALHLGRIGQKPQNLKLAVQDIGAGGDFPFTGSLALEQVEEVIDYVIVGHSERRRYATEGTGLLWKKVATVADSSKTLIFCVGETTKTFDYTQIKVELAHQLDAIKWYPREILLCYEPSWAIGTGTTPAQDILADIFSYISRTCHDFGVGEQVHLIYGGSVNDENIDEILAVPQCEGVIIWTASIDPGRVKAILETLS